MTDRAKVFLSYRRADGQHVAGRAADKLAERYQLFMDIDTIPPGVDFTEYVRRAVGGCDVLLAFIGDRWTSVADDSGRRRLDDPDDWVVAEISTALSRNVAVIPVLIDNATMPQPEQLPEVLRPLLRRQAVPLRHATFSADLTHLIAGIDHVATLAREPDGPSAQGAAGQFAERWDHQPKELTKTPVELRVPAAPRRLAPLIVGALVLLAVVVAAAWYLVVRPQAVVPAGQAASQPASTASESSRAPTVPAAKTVAELRQRVPEAFRRTCKELTTTDRVLATSLVVALQCFPGRTDGPNPEYSFYLQYRDATAAQAAFTAYYASGAPGAADCEDGPGEIPDDRAGGGSGTLRCYVDASGFKVFAWLSPEQAIVASAADRGLGWLELHRWWSSAGPIRT